MRHVFSLFMAGLRALRRDWHAGELRLLALALITAVAAVSSVSFLADRVGQALQRDAAQMLGGDLVIQSGQPLHDALEQQAQALGLDTALTLEFPSMAMHGRDNQLVSVKAVSSTYPLRGQIRLQTNPADSSSLASTQGPVTGTVWVDPQLPGMLQLQASATLQLGESDFQVSGVIAYEPDRSMQFVNVAPRVLMNLQDLADTGLVGPGSRVTYRLLVAGSVDAVDDYQAWLKQNLEPGQRLSTLDSSRPELQRALARAHQFLTLVAVLTVMLSGVAVALATRRYCIRHQDGIATMRCLGASSVTLSWMVWVQFVALALIAAGVGLTLGYGIHLGLVHIVRNWLDIELPASSWAPAGQGVVTALLLLLGFAVPPLLSLQRVPPIRVLRRDGAGLVSYRRNAFGLGMLAFIALVFGLAGDWRLGITLALGFASACAIFALAAVILVWLVGRLRNGLEHWPLLRFALTGMARRRALAVTQLCALSMGLAILILLAITRTDLLQGWQNTVPPDAPNTFLINIQPDQRQAVTQALHDAGLRQAELTPMVRARLVAINDKPVTPDMYDNERAQSMVNREFNLSWRDSLPASNRLLQGRWQQADQAEATLESGLADTLGVKPGQTLTFDFAGQHRQVKVVGLRDVKWDSFEVNFFALLSASVLQDAPASYITSLYLPAGSASTMRQLLDSFPNITVFDIGAILSQVQSVLDQVITAVQLLFLFTVAAGLAVLATALFSTRDERIQEVALLRALGASTAQLSGALRIELVVMGTLSGVLAAGTAQLIAWGLAVYVFQFDLSLSWWPWLVGWLAGVTLALVSGRLTLSGVLSTPPMVSLRAAQ